MFLSATAHNQTTLSISDEVSFFIDRDRIKIAVVAATVFAIGFMCTCNVVKPTLRVFGTLTFHPSVVYSVIGIGSMVLGAYVIHDEKIQKLKEIIGRLEECPRLANEERLERGLLQAEIALAANHLGGSSVSPRVDESHIGMLLTRSPLIKIGSIHPDRD